MPELAPAQPGQPPQPPMGASPATGPTLNRGYEAAAVQKLGLVTKQLTELLSLVGPSSEIGRDILKMLNISVKHAPGGATSPAVERNNIENMAMKNAQSSQMLQQMKQQGGGAPGAAPGGGPPGGMPGAAGPPGGMPRAA